MAAALLPGTGMTLSGAWQQVRGPVIVPLLRASVLLCVAMSAMLFAEKVYMAVVVLAVRLLGRRPERQYRWEPVGDEDPELGSAAYPHGPRPDTHV